MATKTLPAAADLLQHRPLAGATQAQIDALLATSMWPPSDSYRQGTAALTMRQDITMDSAHESASKALRQVHALLTVLEVDEGVEEPATSAIGAALELLSMARGHLEVIRHGCKNWPARPSAT